MRIGFVGIGRMGEGMVRRLLARGVHVVAYNRSPEKIRHVARYGARPSKDLDDLLRQLPGKKIVWLMLPAGKPTDQTLRKLLRKLHANDVVIDGANDFYQNAEKHARWCAKKNVRFLDAGVSGGVHGLKNGYTLMLGGPQSAFREIEPVLRALAPKNGYAYFGPSGSGHFVKSVHNLIEYVYLEGLAEGVGALHAFKHTLDARKALRVWQPASVIRSWLLDLAVQASQRKGFANIRPEIGSVTLEELQKTVRALHADAPAFQAAVGVRRGKNGKMREGKRLIAAIRAEFGGHAVQRKG